MTLKKSVMNGVKTHPPKDGGIYIGGGLKYVIGMALVILGVALGNFVPKVFSQEQAKVASISAHVDRDRQEITRIIGQDAVKWDRHNRRHAEEFSALMEQLVEIKERLARLEP